MCLPTGHRIILIEMNEMDNNSHIVHAFIKYHLLAPYRPVELDSVGFEVHFKHDIGQVSHDIGQVMISVTFILTEIVLCHPPLNLNHLQT